VAFSAGVWAQNYSTFAITGPIEAAANASSDLSAWRVPADGSLAK
jgi:hypothetical protein